MLDLLQDELENDQINLDRVAAIGYQRGGHYFYLIDGSNVQRDLSEHDFGVLKRALDVLDELRRIERRAWHR